MGKNLKIKFWEVITVILLLLLIFMGQVDAQTRYELGADAHLLDISRNIMFENVGTKELTGNNDGEKISLILASVGIYRPAPYCQAYVYFCFSEARYIIGKCGVLVEIPIPKNAVAQSSFNYAKSNGIKTLYTPKIDDLIVWKFSNSWSGHTERIYKVLDKGNVLTVGANTSNGLSGSQREGNGIYKRKRNVKHPIGRMKIRGLVGFRRL